MSASNDDIMEKLESLFALERERNNELYVMRKTYEADMSALHQKMERLPTEVVRQVSGTLQAMVHEARDSAWKEDFKDLFREMAAHEREEQRAQRKQDIQEALKWTQATVKFVLPILQVLAIFISWWLAT